MRSYQSSALGLQGKSLCEKGDAKKKQHNVLKKTSMSPWRPFFEENTSTSKAKQLGLVQNAASIPGGLDFEAG